MDPGEENIMKLRQLFENAAGGLQTIGICYGRFNPPHKGHRHVWEECATNPVWFVGTNQNTGGSDAKNPLPYDVKLQCMEAVYPEIAGHVIPEQDLFVMAAHVYEQYGENVHLKVYTDETWLYAGLIKSNGIEQRHGYFKFAKITHEKTQRLASATDLRKAVRNGDQATFYHDMGVDPSTVIQVGKQSMSLFDVVAHYLNQFPEKNTVTAETVDEKKKRWADYGMPDYDDKKEKEKRFHSWDEFEHEKDKKKQQEKELAEFAQSPGYGKDDDDGDEEDSGNWDSFIAVLDKELKKVGFNTSKDPAHNTPTGRLFFYVRQAPHDWDVVVVMQSTSNPGQAYYKVSRSSIVLKPGQDELIDHGTCPMTTAGAAWMLPRLEKAVGLDDNVSEDAELDATKSYAKGHYPNHNSRYAFDKFVQRSLAHAKEDDTKQNNEIAKLASDVETIKQHMNIREIAGAFPSPSTRQKWANDAAASNRAEAVRQAELQRQANAAAAAKLAVNTADVDRLNKVNYSGTASPQPSNASWDGDSDFLDLDGTKYNRAIRMPISGDVPPDIKLVVTKEGRQVYMWTRNSLKGVVGRYFYPAEKPNTIQEVAMRMQGSSAEEKAANAAARQREIEEKAKHAAIVKAYVDIMAAGQPLPPKMQQSYNTMPEFRKEVDAALRAIPGQPGVVDLEQRKNYHLLPKNEASVKSANDYIREAKGKGGMKKIDPTQKAAMRNASTLPALNMAHGSAYTNYRFGLALAGAPDYPTKMEADNWIGGDPLLSTYTDEEFEMVKKAAQQVGGGKIQNWSGKRSQEMADVQKTSPVAKPKRNKYGI